MGSAAPRTTGRTATSANAVPLHDTAQVVLSVTNADGLAGILRLLRQELVSRPRVEPAADPTPSRELLKLFSAATKEQQRRGSTYLGVDVILRLLLDHVRCSSPSFRP